ncbi:MAG: SDR family oxidoreductase [Candidatus Omnitrophica bacterium]|nr:SDR family oxidoreductase [Candidatus Omnitrophota bacterium]MDD5429926.1 SDR family oxidoreductase [Candidatus Omnitrophota bacterium]
MFKLKGKVIILIGGSGLLGYEFSKAILKQEGRLYSFDISDNSKLSILKKNKNYFFKMLDAGNKSELEKTINKIIAREGKIDVLINAVTAKGEGFYSPFEEVTLESWNLIMHANLTIPFIASQAVIKQMRKQKSGSIINISSVYGIVGNDQSIYKGSNLAQVYTGNKKLKQIFSHPAYNSSKAGLTALTRFLAAYYGKDNIRVNCISPGGIDSGKENKTFLKKYSQKTPLARKARADEINGALIYLASDESTYVTGHNLVVDGGWTAW